MSAAILAQWKPRELILAARQHSLEEFLAHCEATYLLCIRVEDPNSELAVGLATQERADGLGFRTVQRNVSSVVESLAELKRSSERIARLNRGPLAREVQDSPRFVLPLRKRSAAAFLESVSVGRARNHDIVLRHRSVSKFHGSFEFDSQGRVFVRDANSSNHTFVNGQQVQDRQELRAGDNLTFGSVEAYLCTAEDLWRTVRG